MLYEKSVDDKERLIMGKIRLQGHEKFPLRDGWLTKGLEILDSIELSRVFNRDNAPDVFGIGSNMVKALRYWMKAFCLVDEIQGKGMKLSNIGALIKQYDLYIEDDFTLWILHSSIAKNVDEATTWYMFFNRCDLIEFNKENMFNVLKREIDSYSEYAKYSEKSLHTDIDVLLSMYSKDKEMVDPEDKNISPFVQLGLVKHSNAIYTKNPPNKNHINGWVVLYELAERLTERKDISIEEVSHDEMGLSRLYNMTDMEINGYLDRLNEKGKIRVDRTAGLDMIYKTEEITSEMVVKKYYESHR